MSAIERSEPPPHTASERIRDEETVLLEWSMHLFRHDPRRIWVVVGAMLLAAGLGFLHFFSTIFALLGVLLVLTAAAEYIFPIRYRLTTERAMVSYGLAQLDLRWSNVKRVLEGQDAFRLSPFSKESRLEGIRGVTLRWTEAGTVTDRDTLYRIIRERVADARQADAEATNHG